MLMCVFDKSQESDIRLEMHNREQNQPRRSRIIDRVRSENLKLGMRYCHD